MVTVPANFGAVFQKNPFSLSGNAINPLESAVLANDVGMVKLLLENSSKKYFSPFLRAFDKLPLICVAVQKGYGEIVELLISKDRTLKSENEKAREKERDVRNQYWGEALRWAADKGWVEMVRSLYVELDDIDFRDSKGNTALMRAAAGGHLLLVNDLLFHGADINAKNIDGETPLTLAVFKQDLGVVDALLGHATRLGDAGIDLEAAGMGGLTAMELAVILHAISQNGAAGGVDGNPPVDTKVAEDIISALRVSGAAEAVGDVGRIFQAALQRINERELDTATLLVLDELDARGVAAGIALNKALLDHSAIRFMQAQCLLLIKQDWEGR